MPQFGAGQFFVSADTRKNPIFVNKIRVFEHFGLFMAKKNRFFLLKNKRPPKGPPQFCTLHFDYKPNFSF